MMALNELEQGCLAVLIMEAGQPIHIDDVVQRLRQPDFARLGEPPYPAVHAALMLLDLRGVHGIEVVQDGPQWKVVAR